MDSIALIPARGGSKGIPRKNITLLAGKPLIAWTIEAALNATQIKRVIVSTEDDEIAELSRKWGAEVPFVRPPDLSRDDTPGMQPVMHAVRWIEKETQAAPTNIVVLQPTSPLRTAADINEAVILARRQRADGVVSVTPARCHPYWMKTIDAEGRLSDFVPQGEKVARRQDLPSAYEINGAIYLARLSVLLARETFYTDRTFAYVMPPERSFDIDTPWDLRLVELILRAA